ncbi:uncharacterized protein LOC144152572 [Haemaphysalis longicornis]
MAFHLEKSAYLLVGVLVFGAVVAKCEYADVFKLIPKFTNVTAIYSLTATYANASLECLYAELTQFDRNEGTAEYTWYLRNDCGDPSMIVHQLMETDSPYEIKVRSSPDPETVWTAIWPYSDNTTCFILKAQDIENVCVLWVSDDSVDNVSEECTEAYEEICGEGVSLYDKDACTERSDDA